MSDRLEAVFARCYRGRHRAADAYWWLTRPEAVSPTGTRPAQEVFLLAADELDHQGLTDAATALREVTADVLASDRRAALDALAQAEALLEGCKHHPTV